MGGGGVAVPPPQQDRYSDLSGGMSSKITGHIFKGPY